MKLFWLKMLNPLKHTILKTSAFNIFFKLLSKAEPFSLKYLLCLQWLRDSGSWGVPSSQVPACFGVLFRALCPPEKEQLASLSVHQVEGHGDRWPWSYRERPEIWMRKTEKEGIWKVVEKEEKRKWRRNNVYFKANKPGSQPWLFELLAVFSLE